MLCTVCALQHQRGQLPWSPFPEPCAPALHPQDLSLLEYNVLAFAPSLVAAAALELAHVLTRQARRGSGALKRATGYDAEALRPCMELLTKLHGCAWFAGRVDALRPCLPVREKYSSGTWGSVAQFPPLQVQP